MIPCLIVLLKINRTLLLLFIIRLGSLKSKWREFDCQVICIKHKFGRNLKRLLKIRNQTSSNKNICKAKQKFLSITKCLFPLNPVRCNSFKLFQPINHIHHRSPQNPNDLFRLKVFLTMAKFF
jgi:hypothetical protein